MTKTLLLFSFSLTFLSQPSLFAEDVKISTYYPSPFGNYRNLTVDDADPVTTPATQNGALTVSRLNNHLGSHIAFLKDDVAADIMCLGYGRSSTAFGFGPRTLNAGAISFFSPTYLALDAAGNVGVGTTAPLALLDVNGVGAHSVGTAAAPGFSFRTDLDTGMWSSGANTVNFSTGGTERVRIDNLGNVGIGTAAPAATAVLDISSTTKGFLMPRMTQLQRTAIALSVANNGMLVYQTDGTTPGFYYSDGAIWVLLGGGGGGGGGAGTQVVFAVAGTTIWTVPPGVTRITVEVWGAGGGGGGTTAGRWSHGGGGGGYGKQIVPVVAGSNLTIIVGAGGAGFPIGSNTSGVTGGTSSVSGMTAPAILSATGGIGGLANGNTSYNPAFNAGGASAAAFNISGGRGARIYGVVTAEGGDGANGGAGGVGMVDAGYSYRASPGVAPGGGGSGQWDYIGVGHLGTNEGAVGRVVISY